MPSSPCEGTGELSRELQVKVSVPGQTHAGTFSADVVSQLDTDRRFARWFFGARHPSGLACPDEGMHENAVEPKSPVQKGRRDAKVSGPEQVTRKSSCLKVVHFLASAERGNIERESSLCIAGVPFSRSKQDCGGDVVSWDGFERLTAKHPRSGARAKVSRAVHTMDSGSS